MSQSKHFQINISNIFHYNRKDPVFQPECVFCVFDALFSFMTQQNLLSAFFCDAIKIGNKNNIICNLYKLLFNVC